jgi:hypothetical protein
MLEDREYSLHVLTELLKGNNVQCTAGSMLHITLPGDTFVSWPIVHQANVFQI